ncbi:glycoside hydrolase family 47 protein [Apiospora rasikravindrae]|uniref:alpha-1,2-Mannosidase n=1 Tax=Apiospora rasikravindrae TaxID=990691 RepID=A0ABR1U900_9PEZI
MRARSKNRFGNSRRLLPAVAILAVFYVLYRCNVHRLEESQWLANYMNVDTPLQLPATAKSSFNWSRVKHQHPPVGEPEPLPSTKGLRALPKVQHSFKSESAKAKAVREDRRREVRELFQRDWQAYRKYAWMKDALKPMTGTYQDQFSGWAATLVDSLDSLWIMGLREEFNEAVAAVAEIDFGKSSSPRVNTFETNIRYLGGLLAAYDLSKREVLLVKAKELGDLLYGAFNTENRMPVDFIDFARAKTGDELFVEGSVVSASPGTLSLEMTRLSQITGDPKYYNAMSKVMDVFYRQQNETQLPGLWPMMVSMRREDVASGNQFTLAGCADSLYEYLPKMHGLIQGAEPKYKAMSERFMDAADKYMFFRPMIPGEEDILVSGAVNVYNDGQRLLDPETEHLACYLGGTMALGGRLLNRPNDIEIGAKLTNGCIYAYKSMPAGVGPERHNMIACKSRKDCPWDEEVWIQERQKRPEWKEHLPKGFTTAKDPRYILRPEAIESVFLLYRITGRAEFQEAAWDMFQGVRNATGAKLASAAVPDVTKPVDPSQNEDYMESFWLAETLKYFYLAFSPPDLISLDDYVLNTEAHPFLRPK